MQVIVSTMPDQSVAITCPTDQALMLLQEGGGINCVAHCPHLGAWREGLHQWLKQCIPWELQEQIERTGYLPLRLAKAWEVQKYVQEKNWRPDRTLEQRFDIATRFIEALAYGGLTEDEARELIAEKDVPSFYQSYEIMDSSELPQDRMHRNAWRRSRNGGPIYVDALKAQEIDEQKMWNSYAGV
jgi:hypothetical protein